MKDLSQEIVESIRRIENKQPVHRQQAGSLSQDDVKFYLYQQEQKKMHLTVGHTHSVDMNKPVKMIIHGWLETAQEPWIKRMVQNYLSEQQCNVIVVDWSAPARKSYGKSASLVAPVGKKTYILTNYTI